MSGKGISRKAQGSGMADSGSSTSKKPNCSETDAEGATINSGYCSGNNVLTKQVPSKGCTGTDGYNVIGMQLARKVRNFFAAFSCNDTERHGTSPSPKGSNVSGTRNSFNATGTKRSLRPKQGPTIGTRHSFNVKDEGSKMDAHAAIINSGFCAGTYAVEEVQNSVECSGTELSFNADSGGQINLKNARLNTGAYSGNATQGRVAGTGRSPAKGPKQGSSVSGSKNSFKGGKTVEEASTINAANENFMNPEIGTRDSFNINDNDKGSNIYARNATINSGCCAGNKDVAEVRKLIQCDLSKVCSGTERSFDADSGGQINLQEAMLNTGAYSGNITLGRGTG